MKNKCLPALSGRNWQAKRKNNEGKLPRIHKNARPSFFGKPTSYTGNTKPTPWHLRRLWGTCQIQILFQKLPPICEGACDPSQTAVERTCLCVRQVREIVPRRQTSESNSRKPESRNSGEGISRSMMRNRLCHARNAETGLRPFSGNRNAYGRHLNLCTIRARSRKCSKDGFPGVEGFGTGIESFSKSFGGGLAQIRATQACDSERRAWSSAEEFDRAGGALAGPEHKRAPSLRAVFRAGRGRGERGQAGFGTAVR